MRIIRSGTGAPPAARDRKEVRSISSKPGWWVRESSMAGTMNEEVTFESAISASTSGARKARWMMICPPRVKVGTVSMFSPAMWNSGATAR